VSTESGEGHAGRVGEESERTESENIPPDLVFLGALTSAPTIEDIFAAVGHITVKRPSPECIAHNKAKHDAAHYPAT
jgi:hypothetical protein